MDDNEIDIEPRSAAEVAMRAVVLSAGVRRLAVESSNPNESDDALAEAFDLREWLRDQALLDTLTAREAAIIDRPVGSLTPEETTEMSWLGEGLAVLVWSLRKIEMPASDEAAEIQPVLTSVPGPWSPTADWIRFARTVPESVVALERERAEVWHWRATTEVLRRVAALPERHEYETAIEEVAAESANAGLLPSLSNGDFPTRGGGVRDLSERDLDNLLGVTGERLRALNWVCGFGSTWDDVPLDI